MFSKLINWIGLIVRLVEPDISESLSESESLPKLLKLLNV